MFPSLPCTSTVMQTDGILRFILVLFTPKGLKVMDSDPCPQENEPKLERKQEGTTIGVLEEDQTNLDINNNFAVKNNYGEVAVSANMETIAAIEESSLVAIAETEKEVSIDNRDEGGSASATEVHIAVESSSSEHQQDVSRVVNKCRCTKFKCIFLLQKF